MTANTHEFIAQVREGALPLHIRKALGVVLRGYEGKTLKIAIKLHSLRRSTKQNSYYWSVVIPHWKEIFLNYGTRKTNEEVHEYLAVEIGKLEKEIVGPDGAALYYPNGVPKMAIRSSTELSTKEFSEYVETCRTEAAVEHRHDIPPPDSNYKESENNG